MIEIFEQVLKNNDEEIGKIAILRGGLNTENPSAIMDEAVSRYVDTKEYNEFVEIFLDNPWVRVIVKGINELEYKTFKDQKL